MQHKQPPQKTSLPESVAQADNAIDPEAVKFEAETQKFESSSKNITQPATIAQAEAKADNESYTFE